MKDLWDQKNGWGTLTSNIFSTLCNNIILCFIVINNFDTISPYFVIEDIQDETYVKFWFF